MVRRYLCECGSEHDGVSDGSHESLRVGEDLSTRVVDEHLDARRICRVHILRAAHLNKTDRTGRYGTRKVLIWVDTDAES